VQKYIHKLKSIPAFTANLMMELIHKHTQCCRADAPHIASPLPHTQKHPYLYIHTHTNVHIHTYTHIHMQIPIHGYTHTSTHTYVHTHTHTHTHTQIFTQRVP
jgi:hypothetical protein